MELKISAEAADFLRSLLVKLSINPAEPTANDTVKIVQELIEALKQPE